MSRGRPASCPLARAGGAADDRQTIAGAPGTTDVLTRSLVVVTGKGGVGKSTIAAALGLAAAERGRRTVVVEVAGRDDVRRAITGRAGGAPHVERPLAPRLHHLSVEPRRAVGEYLREQLPVRPLATLLVQDRTFGLLTAAAPGLAELVTIGKAWRLTQPGPRRRPGRLVVLDAPSSGHVVALLRAPRTFAALAARGPVGAQATRIAAFLADPAQTAVVVVATPDELAVAEALELRQRLREALGIEVARYVVDRVVDDRFSAAEAAVVAAAAPSRARHAALFAARLPARQHEQVRRLADAVAPVPVTTVPLLVAPAVGVRELGVVATCLAGA